MSDFTAVNAAAMATGYEDLRAAQQKLRSLLDELEGQLGSSLAQWDGAAREAYRTEKTAWDKDADHMAQVIDKMGSVLNQITENYASNEAKIQGSWG